MIGFEFGGGVGDDEVAAWWSVVCWMSFVRDDLAGRGWDLLSDEEREDVRRAYELSITT